MTLLHGGIWRFSSFAKLPKYKEYFYYWAGLELFIQFYGQAMSSTGKTHVVQSLQFTPLSTVCSANTTAKRRRPTAKRRRPTRFRHQGATASACKIEYVGCVSPDSPSVLELSLWSGRRETNNLTDCRCFFFFFFFFAQKQLIASRA